MSSTTNESMRPLSDQSGLPPPIPLSPNLASPTMVDDLQQQAATQPGSGQAVRSRGDHEPGGDFAHSNEQAQPLSKSGLGARPEERVMESPPRDSGESFQKVPFKEQVIGVAQKTRGTLLGKVVYQSSGSEALSRSCLEKPDLKDHGQRILEGKITHDEP